MATGTGGSGEQGAAWGPASGGPAALLRMALGFSASQVLYVAAELAIADHLAREPLTAGELAKRTSTQQDTLARLLNALVAFGVLRLDESQRFGLSPVGDLLRSDVPGSLRSTILFLAGPWSWRAWENLNHSVRTSEPAFDHAWGMSNFEYWERHADVSEIHDRAMAELTAAETSRILQAYDFSQFYKIVDVGGGNGSLLAAILAQHPRTTGILADLPHVIAGAPPVLDAAGVRDRCDVVAGDFFSSVPEGGDAYVLKHIIHDWDEERSLTILKNCHRVMSAGATLLVIDRVLPREPVPGAADGYIADLIMLVVTPGGRERTETEFRALFESAGFELMRVVATGAPTAIVEGRRR